MPSIDTKLLKSYIRKNQYAHTPNEQNPNMLYVTIVKNLLTFIDANSKEDKSCDTCKNHKWMCPACCYCIVGTKNFEEGTNPIAIKDYWVPKDTPVEKEYVYDGLCAFCREEGKGCGCCGEIKPKTKGE